MPKITLHEYAASGNCYKIRLLLAYFGVPYERKEYDIMKGETRTVDFLTHINANGRIPVLEVDGEMIAESNAALWYLAEDTPWLPDHRLGRAQVLQWLFFEQYNHEPNIATVRYWRQHLGDASLSDWQKSTVPVKTEAGYAALGVMEAHLANHQFFVGETCSIADIALYGYTHVAPQGGFDLTRFPNINAWMARLESNPAHVKLDVPYGEAMIK